MFVSTRGVLGVLNASVADWSSVKSEWILEVREIGMCFFASNIMNLFTLVKDCNFLSLLNTIFFHWQISYMSIVLSPLCRCALASYQLFGKFTTMFCWKCDITGKKCKYIRFYTTRIRTWLLCLERCISVNNFCLHLLNR